VPGKIERGRNKTDRVEENSGGGLHMVSLLAREG